MSRTPIGTTTVSRRRLLGGVAGILGLGAAGALSGCAPSKPELVPSDEGVKAAVTVRAIDNRFEPREVEIEPGQAVRWVFEGSMEHDVVAKDGSFVSELQQTGSYTHLFEEAGDYDYLCSIHPEMTGVVRVAVAP
ncbi:cupredoxin domain-containing protein [Leucobacter chromiireducens]|uniref:cupredoxin domain-containing protein n=1 Tax=Leucobacter chromiireducens TaxID=283877 RepID=UPI000F63C2BD|nr:plastocyanin/azurin family copper-binding protein [Leucobacter chromiireducens]